MPQERPARRPVPPVNPYTPKQHLTRHPSESPPPSVQPLPPRSPTSPERTSQSQGIPRSDRPAEPTRQHFDPWNSSSTGHQRAENRLVGSTSWRESRNAKLAAQFAGGAGGGVRLADTVEAGSVGFGNDGRKANGGWERGAPGLRRNGQLAIWESMERASKKRKAEDASDGRRGQATRGKGTDETSFASDDGRAGTTVDRTGEPAGKRHDNPEGSSSDVENAEEVLSTSNQIFRGLCFYINGSTAPMISDHRLKQLLAMHGASTSIALGRRTVTHVILGCSGEGGAGGGLAGGKLQKEIARVGGKGLRYVGVEWVVESVRAGKRLPEAGFSNLKIAAAGQKSVYGMFKRGECEGSEKA
ncbi:DNA repair protein REV1 [Diplodia seriata]|uniref:DNA repair protein REV1 n=1 Tax=Diplodia seriata TaxID=420778 RepID=A0A1S8BCH9_9PEZI|nr:DNA repair protein REV1 [Diplodia seriata]